MRKERDVLECKGGWGFAGRLDESERRGSKDSLSTPSELPMVRGQPLSEPGLWPLAYELPRAARNSHDSWLARLQAIGLITVLLAGVQAQLLGNLPDSGDRASLKAIRIFAYAGLCANMGSTLSAVVMLLAITFMPASARHLYVSCRHSYPRRLFTPGSPNGGSAPEETDSQAQQLLLGDQPDSQLLHAFGIAQGFDFLMQHCIAMFMIGAICAFVQVAMGAWLGEGNVVGAITVVAVILSLLPPLYAFCFLMAPDKCMECETERRARHNHDHEK